MKELKEIIANNICDLRKEKKWTQFELAEKLNFTDKAISKWERAESTPDVDSLARLAEIFEVTVDYFFHEDSKSKRIFIAQDKKNRLGNTFALSLLCLSVFLIATVIFVTSWLRNNETVKTMWITFVWALPICSLFCYILFYKNKSRLGRMISSTALVWTLLASVYLSMLINGINVWMIFVVGVPLEGIILIFAFLKKQS